MEQKKTKQVKNFSSSKIILFPNDHQFITLSIIINDFPPWILVQIVHQTRPNHSALWYHSIFQWYYFLSTLSNVDSTMMPLITPNIPAFLLSIFFSFLFHFFDIASTQRFIINWQKVCKKMWKLTKKTAQNLNFVSKDGESFSQNISSKIWLLSFEKKKEITENKIKFKVKILWEKNSLVMQWFINNWIITCNFPMDGAMYSWCLVTSSMREKGEIEAAQKFVLWS